MALGPKQEEEEGHIKPKEDNGIYKDPTEIHMQDNLTGLLCKLGAVLQPLTHKANLPNTRKMALADLSTAFISVPNTGHSKNLQLRVETVSVKTNRVPIMM